MQSTTATIADGAEGFTTGTIGEAALDYAKDRGISPETLARVGAASGTTYFPRRLGSKSEAVFFPYHLRGEMVNWKACAFPEKDFIGMKGGKLCFWGLDDVLAADPGDVFITEGEWDRVSLVEAGVPLERTLSVPNGGHEKVEREEGDEDEPLRGYAYVEEALKLGLGRHKRFIWCGDTDGPGRALRQDMAKLLGQAKFHFVDWPEGCKDANDYLRSDGPRAVYEMVMEGFLPWPVSGVYTLSELPEPPPLQTWRVPHFPSWEGKIRLAPGTMSIVTGHPGHGKTQLWGQIWHDVAESNDLVVAAASFETRAKPHYRRTLRTLQGGKLERDMGDEEKRAADKWINDHFLWLVHPDQRPTLGWVLDSAEVAVVRYGAKVVQVDPWNRLEDQREPGESETQYIGRCLTALYVFGQDMGVHVQILVHPAKMEGPRKGKPPELDDVHGSKHWDNRVDQGFTVHRPKLFDGGQRCTEAALYHRKARFDELGYPCRLDINYDLKTGRFVETL